MTQLLEYVGNPALNLADKHLAETLQNIVKDVQIKANFSITHPDYKPFELPQELLARILNMPGEIQDKYLSLMMRSFLYGIYYNASMVKSLTVDNEGKNLALDLENNTFLGVDLDFYQQLHNSNKGTGYFAPYWQIIKEESDRTLVVQQGELKLHIERENHLRSEEKSAQLGGMVAIKMPKNLVQNGFYMAVGNQGNYRDNNLQKPPETVRIYFNLTSKGAIEIMAVLTEKLNEKEIPFSFKALYNPDDYGRYDAGVLYFEKSEYEAVKPILKAIYSANQQHFQPDIPLFTKQIAPGLGLAEEPINKFVSQESFGMNRCQIIANALLETWQKGDDSPDKRLTTIINHFSLLGLDINRPYLNANSEDIYEVF
jgi:HopA1 effector protein family